MGVFQIIVLTMIFVWVGLLIAAQIKDKKKIKQVVATKKIETENSWNAFILFKRGEKAYYEENYEQAIKYLNEALDEKLLQDNNSYSAEFYDLRGSCYLQSSYDREAIQDYEKVLEYYPIDCTKHFSISTAYTALNQHERAIENLKKAIELSKIDNQLNRKYKANAKQNGIEDLTMFYQIHLAGAISRHNFQQKMTKKLT